MTPTQLANVRRLMKAQRARRLAASNRAADARDAVVMRDRTNQRGMQSPLYWAQLEVRRAVQS
jgi:hypothetical protein